MLYNIPRNCHCLRNNHYLDLKLYLLTFQNLDEGSYLGERLGKRHHLYKFERITVFRKT